MNLIQLLNQSYLNNYVVKDFNSLNIAKNARNEDAHGPITNEFEAEEVINHFKTFII